MVGLALFQIINLGVHTLFNLDDLGEALFLCNVDVFVYFVLQHLLKIFEMLLLNLALLCRDLRSQS